MLARRMRAAAGASRSPGPPAATGQPAPFTRIGT